MFDHDTQGSSKYCIFSIRCQWQFEMVLQSPIKNNCLKGSLSNVTMCKETHVNLPVQPEPRLPGKTHVWVPEILRSLHIYPPINMWHCLTDILHSLHYASSPLNVRRAVLNEAYAAQAIRPSRLSREETFPPDLSHVRCRCFTQSPQSPPKLTRLSKVWS